MKIRPCFGMGQQEGENKDESPDKCKTDLRQMQSYQAKWDYSHYLRKSKT